MSRAFLALLACLSLTAFTDAGGKFSVDFPAGWGVATAEADGTVQALDPASQAAVFCRANSVVLESLKDQSQAQLNQTYAVPFDHETWAGFLTLDAAKFAESEGKVRMAEGHVCTRQP